MDRTDHCLCGNCHSHRPRHNIVHGMLIKNLSGRRPDKFLLSPKSVSDTTSEDTKGPQSKLSDADDMTISHLDAENGEMNCGQELLLVAFVVETLLPTETWPYAHLRISAYPVLRTPIIARRAYEREVRL